MLEFYFFNLEEDKKIIKILILTFCLTLVLGVINYFVSGIFLFLISFVSLFLAYPTIDHLKNIAFDKVEKKQKLSELFKNYYDEIIIFWVIFIGVFFAFWLLLEFNLITHFYYIDKIIAGLKGDMIAQNNIFLSILINNLKVMGFTFLISFISISGFIFTIVFNSAVLSYFIHISSSKSFMKLISILPHGLLEIGGFFLAGFAGLIFSIKVGTLLKENTKIKKDYSIQEGLFCLLLGIIFIFLGAIIEVYL